MLWRAEEWCGESTGNWVLERYGSCLVYYVNTLSITSNRRTMALLFFYYVDVYASSA